MPSKQKNKMRNVNCFGRREIISVKIPQTDLFVFSGDFISQFRILLCNAKSVLLLKSLLSLNIGHCCAVVVISVTMNTAQQPFSNHDVMMTSNIFEFLFAFCLFLPFLKIRVITLIISYKGSEIIFFCKNIRQFSFS
jgi:hypothetical protein